MAKKLGEILVERSICTNEAVESALDYAKTHGLRLGEALVAQGIIEEDTVVRLVSEQLDVPWVDIDLSMSEFTLYRGNMEERLPLNMEVLKRHDDPEFFKTIMAVPLLEQDGVVYLATTDPSNAYTAADLNFFFSGQEICLALADSVSIERYLATAFEETEFGTQLGVSVSDEFKATTSTFDLDSTDNAPVINAINRILQQAIWQGASDIHIETIETEKSELEIRIRFRIDGKLQTYAQLNKGETQTLALASALAGRVKIMANIDALEKRVPQDGKITTRIAGRVIDMRVSTIPVVNGEKIAIRLLDKSRNVFTLDGLKFQEDTLETFQELITRPNGLILLTGPTGSGKTTTVYASIAAINDVSKHILTVEDPPEYSLVGINQAQVNDRAGFGFDAWFKAALRQDPDIIYFGEIRDKQTASTAISASSTGHLVLTTLHTNSAPSALTRLIDLGVEPFLIVSTVAGIMSQRLVRRVCTKCYTEKTAVIDGGRKVKYKEGEGCQRCNYTGYRGRLAMHELLAVTPAIREAVLQFPSVDRLTKIAIKEGMRTLYEDGLYKVENEGASLEDVLLHKEEVAGYI